MSQETVPYLDAIPLYRKEWLLRRKAMGAEEFMEFLPGFDAPPKHKAKILDPAFEYVHSSGTDITKTWRKFGWVPLGEQK